MVSLNAGPWASAAGLVQFLAVDSSITVTRTHATQEPLEGRSPRIRMAMERASSMPSFVGERTQEHKPNTIIDDDPRGGGRLVLRGGEAKGGC